MRTIKARLLVLLGLPLALLLLAACAPVAGDGRTGLVVVNAPAEARVLGLAENLQELLERSPAGRDYRFVFPASVRFQELRRDMVGQRAVRQASLMARNLGARYAVLAGAPVYEREVVVFESPLGRSRLVTTAITVRLNVVDAETGGVVYEDRTGGAATRLESARRPLPAKEADPDLRRLREDALAELAPALAARLDELSGAPLR